MNYHYARLVGLTLCALSAPLLAEPLPIKISVDLSSVAPSAHLQDESQPKSDLPSATQIDAALDQHLFVLNAHSQLQIEQANQRRREAGEYEFTVRGGSFRNYMYNPNGAENLRDWEVALERPFRLPNKMMLDSDIGAEGVTRGENALGDARHEAARSLLKLWFNWQREKAQQLQWQQQVTLLKQQSAITEKRIQAGDAPRMELNQINANVALANISLQQAHLRSQLAANELTRQFSALKLGDNIPVLEPQAVPQNLDYWQQIIRQHNHELALAAAEERYQQKLAERASAERLPDPTLGFRYANQMSGNQKISGVYFSIPLSYSTRAANADAAHQAAQIASDRNLAVQKRLDADIIATYTQVENNYQIWQQAREAGVALRQNAELIARAYRLGESSLGDTLVARRQALEASLAEILAQLDANESRYRLLLDAHQLWADPDHHEEK
ncbi:MAG: TolC family protein [Sideroxydans sp.]